VPELGIVVGGPLPGLAEMARRAEDAGYESLWVAETSRSAFSQAGVAVQATSRATVGTAIALAFPRSPAITAMESRDLDELSGGRFVLGLGSQVKRVNEQRFGVAFEHPAPKMASTSRRFAPSSDRSAGRRPSTAAGSTRSRWRRSREPRRPRGPCRSTSRP
jgi:alkanesulfonate monooxygenase SsuD/methylene tetrahydromethanopterin reductase-like flavin-dependent oxidoreductase (luciferase family)